MVSLPSVVLVSFSRSTVQIKSHGQKLCRKEEQGVNIFASLGAEDNTLQSAMEAAMVLDTEAGFPQTTNQQPQTEPIRPTLHETTIGTTNISRLSSGLEAEDIALQSVMEAPMILDTEAATNRVPPNSRAKQPFYPQTNPHHPIRPAPQKGVIGATTKISGLSSEEISAAMILHNIRPNHNFTYDVNYYFQYSRQLSAFNPVAVPAPIRSATGIIHSDLFRLQLPTRITPTLYPI